MFHSMFRFRNAWNSFIPSREYFPRGYGQLGCSGFIVADQKGNFISRKTKRFLDYGEAAFRDVESIIRRELEDITPAGAVVPAVRIVMDGRGEEKKGDNSLEERLNAFLAQHGTGIDLVDDEHGECILALQRLLKYRGTEELETALAILDAHFRSEEELMRKHGFGGDPSSSFSALNSHTQDHRRIIETGRQSLPGCQAACASA